MRDSQRSFPNPLLLVGVGFIILGIGVTLLLAKPPQASSASVLPTSTFLPEYPASRYPRVQLKDALAASNSKSAVFVDVRGRDAFDLQHIPGALSIPLTDIASRLSELPKNAWIITYCT